MTNKGNQAAQTSTGSSAERRPPRRLGARLLGAPTPRRIGTRPGMARLFRAAPRRLRGRPSGLKGGAFITGALSRGRAASGHVETPAGARTALNIFR
jgi:hypothetical protein